MTLQTSGPISINDIRTEKGATTSSLVTLCTTDVNPASDQQPTTTAPYSLASWYGYDHAATDVPDLQAAIATTTTAVNCDGTNWRVTVSWFTANANDAEYYIEITVSLQQTPISFSPLVTDLTTASSTYVHDTGQVGNPAASDSTAWRTYKVFLKRRSDDATIESLTTSTVSTTYGDCV